MIGVFDKSSIGQAYKLVRDCWDDIAYMCQSWTTDDGQASQSDWEYARRIYEQSKLNQNQIALYSLTRGDGLSLEIESELLGISNDKAKTDKYLDILRKVYKDVDRIDSRITGYFARTESSDDLPKDRLIRQQVEFVLDAIWDIKYELEPRIRPLLIMERGNLFDGAEAEKVLQYFGQLTIQNNQNGRSFMTDSEFKDFMNRAFCKISFIRPVQIDIRNQIDKKAIHGLFYHYYRACKKTGICPPRDNTKTVVPTYIRLLTDNIQGYDYEAVAANFSEDCKPFLTWFALFPEDEKAKR